MDMILIFSTLALVVFMIFGLVKKYNTTLLLYFISIISLTLFWSFKPLSGDSVITGNALLDALETVAAQMYLYMKIIGMTLLPILGYSVYCSHIKASPLMVKIVTSPLKKLKNPYIAGMMIAFLISGFLRMAVPTASAIAILLLGSLYPVMVEMGISKTSAAAIILMAVTYDWSPADTSSVTAISVATGEAFGTPVLSVTEYFTKYQLGKFIFPFAIIVTACVMPFTNRYFDKKEGFFDNKEANANVDMQKIDLSGVPKFYAIFPLLPLIILIGMSMLNIKMTYSTFAAAFISLLIVLLCETIKKKSLKDAFKTLDEFLNGMCSGIKTVLMGGASGSFAKALGTYGGLILIYKYISALGLGGWPVYIIILMFAVLLGFATGGVSTAHAVFAPLMPGIAQTCGVDLMKVLIPFQELTGHFRAFSPLAPVSIMVSSMTGIDVLKLNKRCVIPTLVSLIATFVASLLFI